jgi:hypothetical protein
MKKITIYILALYTSLGLVSCSKFLDVEPKNNISDDQTIFDKTSSEQAVRGIYSSLASGSYYGTSFQSIGYLSGDNIQWTGSQSQVQEFINHNVRSDNSTISSAWTAIYQTINRANIVIAKVPAVQDPLFTDAYKNQLVGEAYFIRALAYFDLARTWGGAPIVTKPTLLSTDNVGLKRATQDETYAQALSDLQLAEAALPATTNRYRATQKTVWALKARYYLYKKDWVNAEAYATKIISDATNYQLVTPYSSFITTKGTAESVFEIYYNGTTETNSHAGQWLPQTLGGTRQWAPNTAFVTLDTAATIGGTRSTLVALDNQNRWYGTLYRSINASASYVIRTAELYLIRAEARAQQGNTTGAAADLNAVRARAGLVATTATTQADLLLAIENERRIEFAFEPHRWFDLVRTDRAKTILTFTGATTSEQIANRYLLPIPYNEILKNSQLTQNPGY